MPCELQYWDVLSRRFVAYSRFYVSESDSCDLDLPTPAAAVTPGSAAEPGGAGRRRVTPNMSPIWRVEILAPEDFDPEQFMFPM